MYNPYGFHSLSEQYRREALNDARTRHLEPRERANRRARSASNRKVAALKNALAALWTADSGAAQKARS